MQFLIQFLLIVIAIFMVMLVLVQRGRGGGLAGALGGMGGQSAFGTKAGDMFTRITMITAAIWIVLCMYAVVYLNKQNTIAPPSVPTIESGSNAKKPGIKVEKGTGTAKEGEKSSDSKTSDSKATDSKATEGAKPADTKPAATPPADSGKPAESGEKSKSE